MNDDALLSVQAPDGDEAYTRRGDLTINESGLLTTGGGDPVLGQGGPITLPTADSISIAKDGSIWIVPQGGDTAQPQQVDKLKLVSPTGSQIAKGVDGLFREVTGGALPYDPEESVRAEALAGSTLNPTGEQSQEKGTARGWA